MPKKTTCHRTRTMFQSAPAIAGGRCSSRCTRHIRGTCFNPRPPLLAGDARQCARAELEKYKVSIRARHCWRAMRVMVEGNTRAVFVSIRARHCWRAMLFNASVRWAVSSCFNPRPPLLAGDANAAASRLLKKVFQSAPAIAGGRCLRRWSAVPVEPVSIRARHCWRAMLDGPAINDDTQRVSIRARHCWRAMR